MSNPRWRATLAASALALLVALGVLGIEQSSVHTDDGCAVEIHCLACRVTLSTTADVVRPPVTFPPCLLPSEASAAPRIVPRALVAVRRLASRGPPRTSLLQAS